MRIGVIGAGQLGQMLGLAGARLDLQFTFLDPAADPPARSVGPILRFPFDSAAGLEQLASNTDLLTYEFENIPIDALATIADTATVYPPLDALSQAQDRLLEKKLFEKLGIPIPAYVAVDSLRDLRDASQSLGLPLVLKTRRLGYDGKGQRVVRDEASVAAAYAALRDKPLIAEQWVAFDREVSAIGARNVDGHVAVYPMTANRHSGGILMSSRAPDSSRVIADKANGYLRSLLEHLRYVGVLALELFVQGDQLFANEFAPRVHNSGHWTIEGAITSQFENHLRAILNMSLGDTAAVAHAGMINLIGALPPAPIGDERVYLHDYGKAPRPGRKLGHITVLSDSAAERDRKLRKIRDKLTA